MHAPTSPKHVCHYYTHGTFQCPGRDVKATEAHDTNKQLDLGGYTVRARLMYLFGAGTGMHQASVGHLKNPFRTTVRPLSQAYSAFLHLNILPKPHKCGN